VPNAPKPGCSASIPRSSKLFFKRRTAANRGRRRPQASGVGDSITDRQVRGCCCETSARLTAARESFPHHVGRSTLGGARVNLIFGTPKFRRCSCRAVGGWAVRALLLAFDIMFLSSLAVLILPIDEFAVLPITLVSIGVIVQATLLLRFNLSQRR